MLLRATTSNGVFWVLARPPCLRAAAASPLHGVAVEFPIERARRLALTVVTRVV
jgi:hypothetical protein